MPAFQDCDAGQLLDLSVNEKMGLVADSSCPSQHRCQHAPDKAYFASKHEAGICWHLRWLGSCCQASSCDSSQKAKSLPGILTAAFPMPETDMVSGVSKGIIRRVNREKLTPLMMGSASSARRGQLSAAKIGMH